MRKVFLAILTLLYISASIGFTLRTQQCMVMPDSNMLNHGMSKICDRCGNKRIKKIDNRCCRNESRFVKDDKDQNIPEPVFRPEHPTGVAPHASFFEISFNEFAPVTEVFPINSAPPPDSGTPIYVRNRVFLI